MTNTKIHKKDCMKDYIELDGAILPKRDIEDIIERIHEFDVTISLTDLGHRGTFNLLNRLTGEVIIFKKGERVR